MTEEGGVFWFKIDCQQCKSCIFSLMNCFRVATERGNAILSFSDDGATEERGGSFSLTDFANGRV